MTRCKRLIWPLLCLLLAAIVVFLLIQCDEARADRYTVCMYRTVWNEERGADITHRTGPMEEAMWTSGSHDAKPVNVRFEGTILRQSAGYGPAGLNGAFAAAEVNALYDREILTEDWSFGLGIFFTNDWSVCDVYLAIQLPQTPEGDVTATLTVYAEGSAIPAETRIWTGKLGDRIVFGGVEI